MHQHQHYRRSRLKAPVPLRIIRLITHRLMHQHRHYHPSRLKALLALRITRLTTRRLMRQHRHYRRSRLSFALPRVIALHLRRLIQQAIHQPMHRSHLSHFPNLDLAVHLRHPPRVRPTTHPPTHQYHRQGSLEGRPLRQVQRVNHLREGLQVPLNHHHQSRRRRQRNHPMIGCLAVLLLAARESFLHHHRPWGRRRPSCLASSRAALARSECYH